MLLMSNKPDPTRRPGRIAHVPSSDPPGLRSLFTAVLVIAVSGCRAVVGAYGNDAASAKEHVDGLALAFEHRFTNVERAPKFANARLRIARYAFAPSKLVNDSALWTARLSRQSGPVRELELGAAFANGRYTFLPRTGVAAPVRVGDERHIIRLAHMGKDDWQWTTEADHAVGRMPPQRMNDVAHAIFSTLERPASAVRDDYRAAAPRTTKALGRLFVLDSINARAQGDGSSMVTLHVLVQSARLRAAGFPNFARYVAKYVEPTKYSFRLVDRSGAEWFELRTLQPGRVTIRFRSRQGELQPIAGVARRMPDTLSLLVDGSAKLSMFTVGVSGLRGEFVHVDNPRERGWSMRFVNEPKWHLPLITERLLSSPLRRPFEGQGIQFRIGFRTGSEGQTILGRTLSAVVRESAIMRFIGNLGFTAVSDFEGKVEEEENRFLAELFAAVRADVQ